MPALEIHFQEPGQKIFLSEDSEPIGKSKINPTKRRIMQTRKDFDPFLRGLMCISFFALLIKVSGGGEFSESKPFLNFIQSVDPENILRIDWSGLVPHPCSHQWKGVKCSLRINTITEIRLENMNLSGIIDADSLCKLSDLRVLSLATNHIRGNIPATISSCKSLRYLNLSNNLLNVSAPLALFKLKNLRRLDISNNSLKHGSKISNENTMELTELHANETEARGVRLDYAAGPTSVSSTKQDNSAQRDEPREKYWAWTPWLPLVLGIAFFVLLASLVNLKAAKLAKDKEILKALAHSPLKASSVNAAQDVKPEEKTPPPDLMFFVEEEERFRLEDLLEAGADLQCQNFCSSLYKVQLKNNAVFAVKRLKKLQGSLEEFGQTMRKVGELKHPNIIPLVAFSSTSEERLLIYKYQRKGSLLAVLENHIEGKRDFPWKRRLSIAVGIARGLDYIYRRSDELDVIPHGNIKLSNILLNENEEPLISEYGYSKFVDPKTACLFNSNGYTAPEKTLSEQADVFSFGVILLELLTGKMVEKSGLDLPKWVKAMVREEWTGEVFDKEVAKVGMYAFPLLNVSLKCVAHFAENRPAIAEVLEKIEEVVNAQQDYSPSVTSVESSPRDGRLLHSVAEESWDSTGSSQ